LENEVKCRKKKVLLELGGNAGVIITESCNIDLAVNKCVTSAFAYSGQVCIHTQRIYIHENVFKIFIEKFIEQTSKLKFGNPQDIETDISAMIDEQNALRVEQWVEEALNGGALLLSGGKRKGAYFEPTILTNTNTSMKVCSSEIFGPVVTVEKFKIFSEAVEMVNNSQFGLQTGVFTNIISEMNYAFNNLEVGGVILNDPPTFRVDNMPYGGIKNSGQGREGVRYSIFEMLEPKLLVKDIS
jgi:glyceraldehyde-3-phosphate dehydrogenase (NADP+)